MHHKFAFPVLVALCISSFGFADAKNGPNWSRSNRVQPPAAKRQIFARDDQVLALVGPVGFDNPDVLTNGPTSTTTTTSVTSTSTTSTSTGSDSSVTSTSSDSKSTQSSSTSTDSSTPTSTADPTSSGSSGTEDPTTAPTTTPTTTAPGDPLSSILSSILDPPTGTPTSTGSDTLTLIGSNTPTPTPTDPATTNPPNTDTAAPTTTSFDVSSVLSGILSSLTDTSSPTDTNTIIGTDGPTSDTNVPTSTDTGIPPTSTDTAGPTGPTGPTDTVTSHTSTASPTTTTTPFDPNNTGVFPTTSTTLDPGDATTITTQPPTTLSTPTDYGYLTRTSLDLTTIPTSEVATGTDPDAPTSVTVTLNPTATPGAVEFPPNTPLKIVPNDNSAAQLSQADLSKYTAITILFDVSKMPWKSVLDSSELLGQILAFFGPNIAHALGIDPSQVITTSLAAYAKAGWTKEAPNALSLLSTTWNGEVPTEYVSDLSAQIRNQNSLFYTGAAGIPGQLASLVVPTFNIASTNGDGGVAVGANAAGTSAPTDTSKNTIIGVTTTVGVILVLLIAFFLVKMYKRSRESAHRRLSGEPMTDPAMRSYGSQGFTGGAGAGAGGSMGRGNRDSFFFAEDSLRGYQHDGTGSVEDDDSYTSHQPNQARRAPIQASAISQPILRESSMGNW